MDKTITTAFLIIISVVLAMLLFNVTYPAVMEGSDAITSMSNKEADRLRSRIEVIHIAGELDASGAWSDTNGNGVFDVIAWVKNIGSTRINGLQSLDIFFGEEGNFKRIPHESRAGGSYPRWTWSIENAGDWQPAATLRISIQYSSALSSGRYFFKLITPSGLQDQDFIGM